MNKSKMIAMNDIHMLAPVCGKNQTFLKKIDLFDLNRIFIDLNRFFFINLK